MQLSLRDTVLSIVASSVVMVGIAFIGMQLTPSPVTPVVQDARQETCIDEPLVPATGERVQGIARLCFSRDGLQPHLELDRLTSGRLHSAWLASGDMPSAVAASHCLSSQPRAAGAPTIPGRVDATVADAAGRARLTALVRGFQATGVTEIQLLIVDHGSMPPGASPVGGRELLAWQAIWLDPTSATAGIPEQSHLIACVSFRLRGGVETLELN